MTVEEMICEVHGHRCESGSTGRKKVGKICRRMATAWVENLRARLTLRTYTGGGALTAVILGPGSVIGRGQIADTRKRATRW